MASVDIIMAVHGDAPFLGPQLGSLNAQCHRYWKLTVAYDRATSRARDQVARMISQDRLKETGAHAGGFVHAFQAGLSASSSDAQCLAFCDHDDVWHNDKLSRACAALAGSRPALYCAQVNVWDPRCGYRRASEVPRHGKSFQAALVRNVARGNTIVVNRAAADFLIAHIDQLDRAFAHDWWCYQMICGLGGEIICDPHAVLDYRQHDANALGATFGLRATLRQKRAALTGIYRRRVMQQVKSLAPALPFFLPSHRRVFEQFSSALSNAPIGQRLRSYIASGAHNCRPHAALPLLMGARDVA